MKLKFIRIMEDVFRVFRLHEICLNWITLLLKIKIIIFEDVLEKGKTVCGLKGIFHYRRTYIFFQIKK